MIRNKPALFFAILSLIFALLYISTFKMPFRPDIKLHGLLEVSKFDDNDENKKLFYDMASNNGFGSWFIKNNENGFTNLSDNLEEVRKIFKDDNSTILIGFFSLNQKMW